MLSAVPAATFVGAVTLMVASPAPARPNRPGRSRSRSCRAGRSARCSCSCRARPTARSRGSPGGRPRATGSWDRTESAAWPTPRRARWPCDVVAGFGVGREIAVDRGHRDAVDVQRRRQRVARHVVVHVVDRRGPDAGLRRGGEDRKARPDLDRVGLAGLDDVRRGDDVVQRLVLLLVPTEGATVGPADHVYGRSVVT